MATWASMEITAAVLRTTDGPYSLETVTLDDPGPGEVIVRITAAGLCHTDQIPRMMEGLAPIITGHEGAGVVEVVGPDVPGVAVGDHVICSYASCGACRACERGEPYNCETFMLLNLSGRDGAFATRAHDAAGNDVAARWFAQSSFASHALVAARNLVVVDPDLPLEVLAPLGCGFLTGAGSVLEALGTGKGQSLVVFGAGAVGLAAIMAAAAQGAGPIVAVDLHESRLQLARKVGATSTVVGGAERSMADLMEALGGLADFSFDTTGVPGVILDALRILRPGGHCGVVGVQQGDLTLDPGVLIGKKLSSILEGSAVPHTLIPRLIEWWRDGKFPLEELVRTYPFSEIDAAEAASLSGEVIKPVLIPD